MNLSMYGKGLRSVSLESLIELQRETQQLWAHAEESGCEGCYCEVSRWNDSTRRWERFAFEKYFGGEHPDKPDANCIETAQYVATLINAHGYIVEFSPIVHSMPSYGELTELEAAAVKIAEAVRKNPDKYRSLEFDSEFGAICHAGGKLVKQEAVAAK